MTVEVTLMRLGNSLALTLPKKVVEEQNLHPKQKILIQIVKEADLTKHFGQVKRKISGQKFKDLVKAGWG